MTEAKSSSSAVSFEIVEDPKEVQGLNFNSPRQSGLYAQAIRDLIGRGLGAVMRFSNAPKNARNVIAAAARKTGIKVDFSVAPDRNLYVRYSAQREPGLLSRSSKSALVPRSSKSGSSQPTLSDVLRKGIAESPRTNAELLDFVRREGLISDSTTISTLLGQMRQRGTCYKGEDLKWYPAVSAAPQIPHRRPA